MLVKAKQVEIGTTAGTIAAGDDPRFNNMGGGTLAYEKFQFVGMVQPTVGTARFYPDTDMTIKQMKASIGVASTSDILISVKKNGTELTTISILANTYKSITLQNLAIPLLTTDYLTVDIIQAISGENLTITIGL